MKFYWQEFSIPLSKQAELSFMQLQKTMKGDSFELLPDCNISDADRICGELWISELINWGFIKQVGPNEYFIVEY